MTKTLENGMKAWFVTAGSALDAEKEGGVQLCSREFLEVVRSAFPSTAVIRLPNSRALTDRLHQRLRTSPYRVFNEEAFAARARAEWQAGGRPDVVFLNMCETIRLAKVTKTLDPRVRVVLLSHGTQSGDDLYELSGRGGILRGGVRGWQARWKLGADLCLESEYRREFIDLVGVMSDEEEVLERWLGAPQTFLLPRLVAPKALLRNPVRGRVGYVGTLSHTPNRVALMLTLEEREKAAEISDEVRLVGGPEEIGAMLASRFRGVRYLGPLDTPELQEEAATWELFLNPIYWLSKGASMKLAQALAWEIPFVSTRSGARGYMLPGLDNWVVPDQPRAFLEKWREHLAASDRMTERFLIDLEKSRPAWPTPKTLGQALRERLSSAEEGPAQG
jgi:hypothetical protein